MEKRKFRQLHEFIFVTAGTVHCLKFSTLSFSENVGKQLLHIEPTIVLNWT